MIGGFPQNSGKNIMESNNKKGLKGLVIVLMVVCVALVSYKTFLNKKVEKEEPYVPNDVKIDGFPFSFLKLETNKNNLVYSPLSIKYALAMLQEGANGNTKDEIVALIGETSPTKYENVKDVLSVANSVFIRDTYKKFVKDDFINVVKEKYDADVFYDSFKDAENVNNWIEEKTFKLIKNMLKDEDVQDEELEMILVNALAINMEWKSKFDAEYTHSRPFIKENNEIVNVAMMNKSTDSKDNKYYQDTEYNAISLPLKEYDDTNLEFIAIMPRNVDLNTYLTSDDVDKNINDLLSKLHKVSKEELSISIPRFSFEYALNLSDDLKILGINDAFDPGKADFSNMSSRGLLVSDVLHKANVQLSEKGVKASAATVIFMKDNAVLEEEEKEIKYLTFDKPFMFIIRDSKSKEIWFTGTVYEPILWEDIEQEYQYN